MQQMRKHLITIMLDEAVVRAYKTRAGGRGDQTLINETLSRGLQVDTAKDDLREVVRQVFERNCGRLRSLATELGASCVRIYWAVRLNDGVIWPLRRFWALFWLLNWPDLAKSGTFQVSFRPLAPCLCA